MPANEPIDLQPELDEVLQAQGDDSAVSVTVTDIKSPVRTQELPRRGGATRSYTLAAGAVPRRVAANNPRRASIILIAYGGDVYVSYGQQGSQDTMTQARWPAGVPLMLTSTQSVFVTPVTVAITLSTITEMWATEE